MPRVLIVDDDTSIRSHLAAYVREQDLPDRVLAPAAALPAPSIATVQGSLADVERAYVQRVLAESATLEEAATRLGINSTTLWRKRKRWGLE